MSAAEKAVEAAVEAGAGATLSLAKMELSALPESLRTAVLVEALDLNDNPLLVDLPEWIGELHSLRVLTAARCGLTALPETIGRLHGLVELDVSGNKITFLPPQIAEGCKSLQKLVVSDNNLGSLPVEILALPLHKLKFSGNRPIHALSLPLWFLNEAVPRRIVWLFDASVVMFIGVILLCGWVLTRGFPWGPELVAGPSSPATVRSGMFVLVSAFFIALFFVPLTIMWVGKAKGRLNLFRSSWLREQPDLDGGIDKRSYKNWIAGGSVLVEVVQLTSFAFVDSIPWPEKATSAMRWPTFRWLSSTAVIQIMFFLAVGLALLSRASLELTRLPIPLLRSRLGILFFALYLLISLLFFPIVSNLLRVLACTYASVPPTLDNSADPIVACWSGRHTGFAALSLLTIVVFYPFASVSLPLWQERSPQGLDIRFKPTYLVLLAQGKLAIMVMSTLFSKSPVTLMASNMTMCAFLALYGIARSPICTQFGWGRVRIAGHVVAAVACATSIFVHEKSPRNWGPVGGLAGFTAVVYGTVLALSIRDARKHQAATKV
jgi:hypothetical protein